MPDFSNLTVMPNQTIYDALKRIDANHEGYLVVIDQDSVVIGTLTDGDIRRAFIQGLQIQDTIDQVFNRQFIRAMDSADLGVVINLFKTAPIKFLPIVDLLGKLVNIISKGNVQTLLMEDIDYSSDLDFLKLDDALVDHEIYNRPWGYYKTTFLNADSQSKIMIVSPNSVLSLQKHHRREEYWVIIKGHAEVTVGESVKLLKSGDFIYIPKGCKHRLKNASATESLFVSEVQLGDYFGEDDIIRYEDIYGRV